MLFTFGVRVTMWNRVLKLSNRYVTGVIIDVSSAMETIEASFVKRFH